MSEEELSFPQLLLIGDFIDMFDSHSYIDRMKNSFFQIKPINNFFPNDSQVQIYQQFSSDILLIGFELENELFWTNQFWLKEK